MWHDHDNPINRFRKYIEERGWWNDEEEKKWQAEVGERKLGSMVPNI